MCLEQGDREMATAYMELVEQLLDDAQEPLRRGELYGHLYEYADLAVTAAEELNDRFFLFEAFAFVKNLHEQNPDHWGIKRCYDVLKWHVEQLDE